MKAPFILLKKHSGFFLLKKGYQQLGLFGHREDPKEPGSRGGRYYRTKTGRIHYGEQPHQEQKPLHLLTRERELTRPQKSDRVPPERRIQEGRKMMVRVHLTKDAYGKPLDPSAIRGMDLVDGVGKPIVTLDKKEGDIGWIISSPENHSHLAETLRMIGFAASIREPPSQQQSVERFKAETKLPKSTLTVDNPPALAEGQRRTWKIGDTHAMIIHDAAGYRPMISFPLNPIHDEDPESVACGDPLQGTSHAHVMFPEGQQQFNTLEEAMRRLLLSLARMKGVSGSEDIGKRADWLREHGLVLSEDERERLEKKPDVRSYRVGGHGQQKKEAKKPSGETVAVTFSVGRGAKRPWVAQVTGTDPKYGYAQSFMRGDESVHAQGADYQYDLEEGLYRAGGATGVNDFFVVARTKSGKLAKITIPSERAKAIAQRLQRGEDFNAARVATK